MNREKRDIAYFMLGAMGALVTIVSIGFITSPVVDRAELYRDEDKAFIILYKDGSDGYLVRDATSENSVETYIPLSSFESKVSEEYKVMIEKR